MRPRSIRSRQCYPFLIGASSLAKTELKVVDWKDCPVSWEANVETTIEGGGGDFGGVPV